MRARAKHFIRWHNDKRAHRCKKCRNDRHRRLSIVQEAPVPQYFLEFTQLTIGARTMSLRLSNAVKKPCARTLSRKFWQQKNFHCHSVGVASTLAKTELPGESLSPIRTHAFGRDGEFGIAMNDRCALARISCRVIDDESRPVTGRFRCRASLSGDRSRPADWPCPRTASSPGRRTSRRVAAWLSPARPCPDWPR